MKKALTRKTAVMVVSVMLATILFPVIAFAGAWFTTGTSYNSSTQTVSGQVYIADNVYNALSDKNKIALEVYTEGGVPTVVYATYMTSIPSGGDPTKYYYSFSQNVSGLGYTSGQEFFVRYTFPGQNVTEDMYSYSDAFTYQASTNIIIAPPASTTDNSTVKADASGKVDGKALSDALKNGNGEAKVEITGDSATLPASALADGKGVVKVESPIGSYSLPTSVILLDDLVKRLGVDKDDVNIKVSMPLLLGDDKKAVDDAAGAVGGKTLGPVVDFKVTAEGNGKTVEINDFGSTYVDRSINLSAAPGSTATGVLYNPATRDFSFVPTSFVTIDGKSEAVLTRPGNSIYTVISLEGKSFADLNNHWAKAEVEKLANKLLVSGSNGSYEPERSITRAEFAAIVVRALGLNHTDTSSTFSDVSSSEWYADEVVAAAKAGIISGYGDGTFKPNANITRQEVASLVVRASKFAGKDLSLNAANAAVALAPFADAGKLSSWAKNDVAAAVKAGIVSGQKADTLAGSATATRAEAAAMVNRFLTNVGFIS